MPTKNPRINITLEHSTIELLTELAKQTHQSVSHLAKTLMLEALERREDQALANLSDARDLDTRHKVSHTDVWK